MQSAAVLLNLKGNVFFVYYCEHLGLVFRDVFGMVGVHVACGCASPFTTVCDVHAVRVSAVESRRADFLELMHTSSKAHAQRFEMSVSYILEAIALFSFVSSQRGTMQFLLPCVVCRGVAISTPDSVLQALPWVGTRSRLRPGQTSGHASRCRRVTRRHPAQL
jgi:hypothetical protein